MPLNVSTQLQQNARQLVLRWANQLTSHLNEHIKFQVCSYISTLAQPNVVHSIAQHSAFSLFDAITILP